MRASQLPEVPGKGFGRWDVRAARASQSLLRRLVRLILRLPGKPEAMVRLRRGIEVILTIALAWIMAEVAWVWMTPDPTGALDARDGAPATARVVRKEGPDLRVLTIFDPFNRQMASAPARRAGTRSALPETSLDLKLMGVRMTGDGGGSAIILTPDKTERAIGAGAEIIDGVTLEEVRDTQVVISRRGVRESLYLDPEAAERQKALRTVSPVAGPERLDMASFLEKVRVEPRLSGGQVTGLTLYPRGSEGLFAALGLEPGDVLMAINGQPVSDATGLARFGRSLSGPEPIRLEIERNGTERTIDLKVPE